MKPTFYVYFSMDLAKIVIVIINVYDYDYACLSETMKFFIYIKMYK